MSTSSRTVGKAVSAKSSAEPELDVFPLDVARLPPEFQASIARGEADIREGRVVEHPELQRSIEQMRRRRRA